MNKDNNVTVEINDEAMARELYAAEGAQNALEERMFKLRKRIPEGIPEELEALDSEDLKKRIAQCESNILESEKAREADTNLADMKAQAREASAPYREVKKVQRAIAEYAACLLDRSGKA
jgi:hypothetical protein